MKVVPLARSLDSFTRDGGHAAEPYAGVDGLVRRVSAGVAGASMIASGWRRGSWRGAALAIAGADLLCHSLTKGKHLYDFVLSPRRKRLRRAPAFAEGESVTAAVTVKQPAPQLYALWRNFENLPYFMEHVKRVRTHDRTRSHWEVEGPLGMQVEWDARVIADRKNELIGWKTLEGDDVAHAGSVRFEPLDTRSPRTRVRVKLQFRPAGGRVGSAIAAVLGADPQQRIEDDLAQFKGFAESMDLDELIGALERDREALAARA